MREKRLIVFGLMACLCASVDAAGHKLSSSDACDRLRHAIATLHSAPHGSREYRCDLDPGEGAGHFYVFALRSNFPAPPGSDPNWTGSALVGWFAVSRESGEVYEWDVGEESKGRIILMPAK